MESTSWVDVILRIASELGGMALLAVGAMMAVRRFLRSTRDAVLDQENDRRISRLEHEQRVARLFPGTRSLEEASRVRLDTLGDGFCPVEVLAQAQRLFLAHLRGEPIHATEGARETLAAGASPAEVLEVLPLHSRLLSAEQSGDWRTVEIELEGARYANVGGEPTLTHERARWRLRCPSDRPLAAPDEADDGGWQLQSVPLQERTRLDRQPPRLEPWGDVEARAERADRLTERRAAVVDGLSVAAADLESQAGALVLAALEEGGAGAIEPLASQLRGRARLGELRGPQERRADLAIESVAVLDVHMDARWRTALARVELRGRRWLEPGELRPVLEASGVVIVAMARRREQMESGWSAYGLWPGDRVRL